jgi:hypothetical protein
MIKILKVVAVAIVLFVAGSAQGQVSLNVNIGTPPLWGPVGYSDVQYYYLPDVEAYYDVPTSMFIYYEGRSWVHRSYLPVRYRNYDLYGGYKVPMSNYHGRTPYYNHNEYRTRYAKGYRGNYQRTIGERPGKGNYNQKNYRESNQVNRGRGGVIDRNDRHGDHSYDKRGNENKKGARGNSQGNGHGGGKGKK